MMKRKILVFVLIAVLAVGGVLGVVKHFKAPVTDAVSNAIENVSSVVNKVNEVINNLSGEENSVETKPMTVEELSDYKLKTYSIWQELDGVSAVDAKYVWYWKGKTYYSNGCVQYEFDLENQRWKDKIWKGLCPKDGMYVWNDGVNCYYDSSLVLNDETGQWEPMEWKGLVEFDGWHVKRVGNNVYVYVSYEVCESETYKLDIQNHTWNRYEVNKLLGSGLTHLWTIDGVNWHDNTYPASFVWDCDLKFVRSSEGAAEYNLPKGGRFFESDNVICYFCGVDSYIYDKKQGEWFTKKWQGISCFYTFSFWHAGSDWYCCPGDGKVYILTADAA